MEMNGPRSRFKNPGGSSAYSREDLRISAAENFRVGGSLIVDRGISIEAFEKMRRQKMPDISCYLFMIVLLNKVNLLFCRPINSPHHLSQKSKCLVEYLMDYMVPGCQRSKAYKKIPIYFNGKPYNIPVYFNG